MALRSGQLSLLMLLISLTSITAASAQEADDSPPPPPDAAALDRQAIFHLALVINHYDTQQVVPVAQRQGDYYVASADLQRAGL